MEREEKGEGLMNSQTSSATDPISGDEKDVVAIRTLYKQMIDGWNSGSGDAFAGPFTDE